MILDNEKSFESIVEIYGGFPLKENYLELGNTVLEKYGLKAEYQEGLIQMPYINRPYYSEEDFDDCRDHGFSEKDIKRMMESRFYADIFILSTMAIFYCPRNGYSPFCLHLYILSVLLDAVREWLL